MATSVESSSEQNVNTVFSADERNISLISPSNESERDRWPYLLVSRKYHRKKVVKNQPQEMAGAQETIYLCNFRVSVDGEWLCLKELQDVEFQEHNNHQQISPPSPVEPWALFAARDPVLIEKSNLVNISKLVVKELIETSQKFGRMLDSDHMPLQHFFIVLEHVLRHGLKPKKGLLGPKKELWDLLQLVEKLSPEAQDITASVRDLPTVSTHIGRARAWLRVALMQKKLADYLKILIDNKDNLMKEFYEPDALMMSDEAFIIIGLLVGLNVIDCNLCVKEENLDCQQGVIDFSLYLRSSHQIISCDDVLDPDNMTTVLDQKNYIEELNRHLNATVTNLQAKLESVQTTNALMKEDLDITKHDMSLVCEENSKLKKRLLMLTNGKNIDKFDDMSSNNSAGGDRSETTSVNSKKGVENETSRKSSDSSAEVEELKVQLEAERKKCQELNKELKVQISMKSEKEVAMKLLEKDVREKQDTIVTLRKQLEDIKSINLEMYKKLQESESTLKQKTELVIKLEAKTVSLTSSFDKLEQKLSKCENDRKLLDEASRHLGLQLAEKDSKISSVEGDLRIEREWRQSLQVSNIADKEKLALLNQDLKELRRQTETCETLQKYTELQEEYKVLKDLCSQHELTLEELGKMLSVSKLKMIEMQEDAKLKSDGQWASDKEATHCKGCAKEFSIARRKHHCRHCGEIFCNSCSDNTTMLPSSARPARVCDGCHVFLVARSSVS